MDNLTDRLTQAFEYLRYNGAVRTIREFASALGRNENHVSAALKGDTKRCTLGLMKRIADAFPTQLNRDYLLTGEGSVAPPDTSLRPHVESGAAAGFMFGIADPDYGDLLRPSIPELAPYDFTINAVGDSMQPRIESGDILACRTVHDRANVPLGKVCVLDTTEGAVVKELRAVNEEAQTLTLHSFNPDYPDYDIPMDTVLNIAVVVGILIIL